VLATSDIRSKTRKETASEKLSRHLIDVEMTRVGTSRDVNAPHILERISKVASTGSA